MDEASVLALIFSAVVSCVLLAIAPVIAELMLQLGKGAVSPRMIGAIQFAAAAVPLLFRKGYPEFRPEIPDTNASVNFFHRMAK